ncbi:lysophospholipid acyltransferase family protein [Amycolatopsis alkalitolerans]|uniref:1-acyl-sn-glycerol-3-phosphate acyltransferase n=1 Tax=Amycolatopsis alkalitolerans TaxID=2547244 RepID=A0A5C4M346_9PSEU|nr:lysophospholipid acyltransferase family protein [Amycolatopsis alkalitolerans]TNC27431.1 1-acyl-sn-glycerol-3-phosphate acyltransferase [Amycolatopsis alkalitolerans]
MAELVYPPVILFAKTMFRVLDLKPRVEGGERLPRRGGAVIACNHVSYLDFVFCGFGALPAKRRVRFMAKESVFRHRISGPLMRGMRHIPVDRKAGRASYDEAVRRLRAGEVVGVFPEATISPSFTVEPIKSGAVRMAEEAGVPVFPMAVWGGQRLWTKGHPKRLTQRHVPISILVGEPLGAGDDLRTRMSLLLDKAQAEYPDEPSGPDDRWWLPAHLGGTAPKPPT